MSARTSGATLGRPGPFRWLFQVQKSLKPIRCQRDPQAARIDGKAIRRLMDV
jgi:hypothetical protein